MAALDRNDRRAALDLLMRAHGDAVYDFCQRSLQDATLARDVHQQCFVQAWEDLPRFSRRSSLKTWLFSIAHHRCLDAAKGRRRLRNVLASPETLPEVEDARPGADAALERGIEERAVQDCLQALAPAARNAVALRFQEGFTYEEMAAVSGERPGTLRERVVRALPLLRQCLQSRGVQYER